MTYTITTTSSEETEQLGSRISHLLKGNELIELKGDLGAGKTTLTRGLLRGLGYKEAITSPTFTIMRSYDLPHGGHVAHIDLYRLAADNGIDQTLTEAIEDDETIVIAEWATPDRVDLPIQCLKIELRPDAADFDTRVITVSAPKELQYILEGLDI